MVSASPSGGSHQIARQTRQSTNVEYHGSASQSGRAFCWEPINMFPAICCRQAATLTLSGTSVAYHPVVPARTNDRRRYPAPVGTHPGPHGKRYPPLFLFTWSRLRRQHCGLLAPGWTGDVHAPSAHFFSRSWQNSAVLSPPHADDGAPACGSPQYTRQARR